MRTVDLHEVIDVVANAYNNGKKGNIETMALNDEDNKLVLDYFRDYDLPTFVRNVLEGDNVSVFVVGVKRLNKFCFEPIWQFENAKGKSVTFYLKHGEVKIIGGE
jgi:hypothetical protein